MGIACCARGGKGRVPSWFRRSIHESVRRRGFSRHIRRERYVHVLPEIEIRRRADAIIVGDWFKILQITGRESQSIDFSLPENAKREDKNKSVWGTYLIESVWPSPSFFLLTYPIYPAPPHRHLAHLTIPQWNFTIPATTPPGSYLLRWEVIFPNQVDAQFYVNCAHVQVVNDGVVGIPGPLVKIPGLYERGQKDVYFSSYDYGIGGSLDGFVPPKPEVWRG